MSILQCYVISTGKFTIILDFKLLSCSECYMPPFQNTLSVPSSCPPMKMEQTECSETLAHKIQTLGNYPEEGIQIYHCFGRQHGLQIQGQAVQEFFSNCLILKMEALCLSTISVTLHPSTRLSIPENLNLQQHLVPDPQISRHVTCV